MKETKKKIQKNFGVTAGLLVLSVLYTAAVRFIDVRPIGPQGSSVGFAAVNQYFHTLFGTHLLLYNITDWLSIPVLFVMLGFALVGLVQLIKRRSLLRVDSSILILGGFYVLVFLVYLFFEFFVVNYRPVLINGFLEASYPSSTTMLMMCIMPTAIMQFQRLISSRELRNIVNVLCCIYAGFMVIGSKEQRKPEQKQEIIFLYCFRHQTHARTCERCHKAPSEAFAGIFPFCF